eukprot:jgi/Phyca11/115563/e_gw1.28.270.1
MPQRKRGKGPTRREAAFGRAVDKLGEESGKKLRDDWNSWDTSYGGQSEGVVLHLLQQGLSQCEIRAVIPVGGSRIDRLRKILVKILKVFNYPVLEEKFPCTHRRPRQYITEPNLTWNVVHARYVDDITRKDPTARTTSYSRFTQYIHFYYPGVKLTRTVEDVCD